MDDKLVFENYQFDNWHLVNELFDAVYGADSDKFPSWAELNWRYRNDLFKSVIWVAKSNNEQIVAMRPTVIKSVRIGGEKLTAVHFMDAMTHPDFRRQGLFTRLTHQATNGAIQNGVELCYTFPNENSFVGYAKKTDWVHVGSLPLFVKLINVDALMQWKVNNHLLRHILASVLRPALSLICQEKKNNCLDEMSIRQVKTFDERFDTFWNLVADDYKVILKRNHYYLNWRYGERPSTEYVVYEAVGEEDLLGFIVVRTRYMFGVKLGLIVDILTLNRDQSIAQALIAKGVEHLKQMGVDAIGCLMFDHQPYCSALRREGFFRVPNYLMPRRFYFLVRSNQKKVIPIDVLEKENWYLTWGDNDAV